LAENEDDMYQNKLNILCVCFIVICGCGSPQNELKRQQEERTKTIKTVQEFISIGLEKHEKQHENERADDLIETKKLISESRELILKKLEDSERRYKELLLKEIERNKQFTILELQKLADSQDDSLPNKIDKSGIEWVYIKSGYFSFRGKHIHIDKFWISKTEVTVKQYRLCVKNGNCTIPGYGFPEKKRCVHSEKLECHNWYGYNTQSNWEHPQRHMYPMNYITIEQARVFAKWANSRLPYEHEWEFVATNRGERVTYPWGNELINCDYAIISPKWKLRNRIIGCGRDTTWPVCSRPKGNTKQGLCDVLGNVSEYIEHSDKINGLYNSQSAPIIGESLLKGGNYSMVPRYISNSSRNKTSTKVAPGIGFRLIKPLKD